MPAASATGSSSAGAALEPRERRHDDHRDEHRRREPVDRSQLAAAGDAVREHDVAGEEHGVGDRERDAERLPSESHVDQQVHTDHRERERGEVAQRADAERGERDHRQELDRRDRAQRQPVDGEVEADVHHREHDAERARPTPRASRVRSARHGLRQSAKSAPALAIRSQATPSGSTRENSSTANAGPR